MLRSTRQMRRSIAKGLQQAYAYRSMTNSAPLAQKASSHQAARGVWLSAAALAAVSVSAVPDRR